MFAQDSDLAPQRRATSVSRIVSFLMRALSAATARGSGRRLRLCETLSLGEKRFVAIVECDRRTYLLAGAPQSISLLMCLDGAVDPSPPRSAGAESAQSNR